MTKYYRRLAVFVALFLSLALMAACGDPTATTAPAATTAAATTAAATTAAAPAATTRPPQQVPVAYQSLLRKTNIL